MIEPRQPLKALRAHSHRPPESAPTTVGTVRLPRENVYGSVARLDWLSHHLRRSDRVVELGCGTGYMISLPLRIRGYDVRGVDLDVPSIEYGRRVLCAAGLDPAHLEARDLRDIDGPFDAVIASEVLEHLDDDELIEALAVIGAKLARGGRLLVTVPSGWTWFEADAALFWRTPIHRIYAIPGVRSALFFGRRLLFGDYVDAEHPNTIADSPHRQRFTWRSIGRTLEHAGFDVVERRGSVLCCGPIADVLFTGSRRAMALNERLGRCLPWIASGYWLAAVRRDEPDRASDSRLGRHVQAA
jgi:SAM-dependent methyltransferase